MQIMRLTGIVWILALTLSVCYCDTQNEGVFGLPQKGSQETMNLTQSASSCPPNDPEGNKSLVKRFLQEVIGNKKTENLVSYFAQDLINHNPVVGDGLEAFRKEITSGPLSQDPPFQIDFQRVSAEDNLVWAHTRLPVFGKVWATVSIFRIECGKIQEYWDVMQDTTLMSPAANPHPFF